MWTSVGQTQFAALGELSSEHAVFNIQISQLIWHKCYTNIAYILYLIKIS